MSKLNDHTIRVTVTLSLFPDPDNAVALDVNDDSHRDAIVTALDAALSDVEVTVFLAPETEGWNPETEITFGGELYDTGTIVKFDGE